MEPAAAKTGPYVLNLCSSTTPLALAQIDREELKRFTFFVSRRFEEGRERFRLHMGYFASLAEAQEWLALVRDIYPSAWAGAAPEQKPRNIGTGQTNTPPASRPRAAESGRARARSASPPPAAPTARQLARPAAPEKREISTRRTASPPPANQGPSPARMMASTAVSRLRSFAQSGARAPGNPLKSSRDVRPTARETAGRIPLLTATEPSFGAAHNEAVFAIHLLSVAQPEDIGIIPRLPIFDSHMLYTIKGRHDGSKFYGLRLGFFSDARAARQVAHQLRREFGEVSVVSVSAKERMRVVGELGHDNSGYEGYADETAEPRRARKSSRSGRAARSLSGAMTSDPELGGLEELEASMETLGEGFDDIEEELQEEGGAQRQPAQRRSPLARLLGRLTERFKGT
jgi:hypothetical protein